LMTLQCNYSPASSAWRGQHRVVARPRTSRRRLACAGSLRGAGDLDYIEAHTVAWYW